jgi:hypothetical protein
MIRDKKKLYKLKIKTDLSHLINELQEQIYVNIENHIVSNIKVNKTDVNLDTKNIKVNHKNNYFKIIIEKVKL